MGVFQHDHPRSRRVRVVGIAQGESNPFEIQCTVVLVGQNMRVNASQSRAAARLVEKSVRKIAEDNFLAPPGVRQQGNKVAHRTRSNEQAGFFAECLCHPLFQPANGRIFTIDIIPHWSNRHRFPHGLGGSGNRIAPQVDDVHGRSSKLSWVMSSVAIHSRQRVVRIDTHTVSLVRTCSHGTQFAPVLGNGEHQSVPRRFHLRSTG